MNRAEISSRSGVIALGNVSLCRNGRGAGQYDFPGSRRSRCTRRCGRRAGSEQKSSSLGSSTWTIGRLIRRPFDLYADASGDYPETIEFHPLLTVDPPDSAQNKSSHDTVVAILHYFFPDWKDEDAWVSAALKAANDDDAEHAIKLDGAILYIRSLNIEDGEGSYAMVVVTRKASIDQWTVDKTSIVK